MEWRREVERMRESEEIAQEHRKLQQIRQTGDPAAIKQAEYDYNVAVIRIRNKYRERR